MDFKPVSQNGIIPPTELGTLSSTMGCAVATTSSVKGAPFVVKAISDAAIWKTVPVTFYSIWTTGTTTVTQMIGTATWVSTTTAALVTYDLNTGTNQIYADWPGEGPYAPKSTITSPISTFINSGYKLGGTINIAASPASGQAVVDETTVTFTVSFNTSTQVTGQAIFLDNHISLGSASISNNHATFSTTNLASGTNTVTVAWGGGLMSDGKLYEGTRAEISYDVLSHATLSSLTLSSSANPSVFNYVPVVFTATANTSTQLSGTVSFYADDTLISTANLINNSASVSVPSSQLSIGSHSVYAVYNGSETKPKYFAKTSNTLTQVVSDRFSIGLTLTASNNPIDQLKYGTFIATASGDYANYASGNVIFYETNDSGTAITLGTGAFSNGVASYRFNPNGLTLTTSTVHKIQAQYLGQAGSGVIPLNGTTTNILSETVNRVGLTVTPQVAPVKTSYSTAFTAVASTTTVDISSTVSFYEGTRLIGSAYNAGNTAQLTVAPRTFSSGTHQVYAIWDGSYPQIKSSATTMTFFDPDTTITTIYANTTSYSLSTSTGGINLLTTVDWQRNFNLLSSIAILKDGALLTSTTLTSYGVSLDPYYAQTTLALDMDNYFDATAGKPSGQAVRYFYNLVNYNQSFPSLQFTVADKQLSDGVFNKGYMPKPSYTLIPGTSNYRMYDVNKAYSFVGSISNNTLNTSTGLVTEGSPLSYVDFGISDWTIDFWARANFYDSAASTSTQGAVVGGPSDSFQPFIGEVDYNDVGKDGFILSVASSPEITKPSDSRYTVTNGKLRVQLRTKWGGGNVTDTNVLVDYTTAAGFAKDWVHVALVGSGGNTIKLYLNGQLVQTASKTYNFQKINGTYIGQAGIPGTINVDQLRITRSVRYTSNFTPLRFPIDLYTTTGTNYRALTNWVPNAVGTYSIVSVYNKDYTDINNNISTSTAVTITVRS